MQFFFGLIVGQVLENQGHRVVCADFSVEVARRCATVGNPEWVVCDAAFPPFRPGAFDVICDKGLLDSVFSNLDRVRLWKRLDTPFDETARSAAEKAAQAGITALKALERLIRPGGVWLIVSYETPTDRLSDLQKTLTNWTITVAPWGDPDEDQHLYLCKRET